MPIEAGQRYDATPLSAKMTESKALKPGIWVNFAILDGAGVTLGTLAKTIWLTPANREQARKELQTLGATEAQVTTTAGFSQLVSNLNEYIDSDCSVTTEEEEYQGRKTVKVKWINHRLAPASRAALDMAESLFGDDAGFDDSGTTGGDPGPEEVPY